MAHQEGAPQLGGGVPSFLSTELSPRPTTPYLVGSAKTPQNGRCDFRHSCAEIRFNSYFRQMTIRVRPATLADFDWLCSQLRIFSAAYGTTKVLFPDDDFARQWLTKMIQEHLLLIADGYKDHERVGLICGIVTPHLYNPGIRVLAELFWWVVPEHRNGAAAVRLLDEFIAWGKINADWITFGTMSETPVKEAALVKRGFVLKEKSYLMEVS